MKSLTAIIPAVALAMTQAAAAQSVESSAVTFNSASTAPVTPDISSLCQDTIVGIPAQLGENELPKVVAMSRTNLTCLHGLQKAIMDACAKPYAQMTDDVKNFYKDPSVDPADCFEHVAQSEYKVSYQSQYANETHVFPINWRLQLGIPKIQP